MKTPGSPLRRSVAALALASVAAFSIGSAEAATSIWRCGNSYSDQPCAQGKAIEAEEAPSAERRRQADEGTRRDLAAAQAMERERLRLEAEQAKRRPLLIGSTEARPAAAPKAEALPKAKKPRTTPKDFTASYTVPGEKKEEKKKKSKSE